MFVRKEQPLREEMVELYYESRGKAKESLDRLGIDSTFLDKLKEPQQMRKVMGDRDKESVKEISKALDALNSDFARRNGLPEKVENSREFAGFLSSFIEKNYGRKVDVLITEQKGGVAGAGAGTIAFEEGCPIIQAVRSLGHEISHTDEKFSKELIEVSAKLLQIFEKSDLPVDVHDVDFYAKFTGASRGRVAEVYREQVEVYGTYDTTTFLVMLYDRGIYKPADEKMKQNMESLRFMLYKPMRRGLSRYSEGKAILAEMGMLESEDDALRGVAAIELMRTVADPSAQFYKEQGTSQFWSRDARKAEGFRAYYSLQKYLGEKTLQEFEESCIKRGYIPAINEEGGLAVIDKRKVRMDDVDMEKLKDGERDIEELKLKSGIVSQLPERLNSLNFI